MTSIVMRPDRPGKLQYLLAPREACRPVAGVDVLRCRAVSGLRIVLTRAYAAAVLWVGCSKVSPRLNPCLGEVVSTFELRSQVRPGYTRRPMIDHAATEMVTKRTGTLFVVSVGGALG